VNTTTPGVNHPPVADAGRDLTTYLSTVSLDGSNSYDPDGDNITYSWTMVSGPTNPVINNNRTPKPTVDLVLNAFGTYVFQLTVTDTRGASSTARVTVSYR
jgi:chitinase